MSDQQVSFQPSLAVSTVFEQIRSVQAQLSQIAYILEPLQQLCQLASVFEALREFEVQISCLAKVLEPMHNFQDQLRQVLPQFTPLRPLDQELDQLSVAFCESLTQLAGALEPAATLQDRLAHLAVAFEQAKTLRQDFSALARSFERSSQALPQ